MDDRERADERPDEEPEALEDMDVPEQESEDVKGGAFKQGWPVKWQGSS